MYILNTLSNSYHSEMYKKYKLYRNIRWAITKLKKN
jgi:hypothetical protein